MPSPTTALEIMGDALALVNAVGVDQTLSAKEVSDCLRGFNNLLELFATRNLAVYGATNQTFTTIAHQGSYTIGVGGDFNTTRPIRIEDAAFSTYQGIDYACKSMTQDEYNGIPIKTDEMQFPERFLYVNTYPLGTLYLYRVPSGAIPLTLPISTQLSQITSANASVSFPPGYTIAFTYTLAMMYAPMFGKRVSDYPDVVGIANEAYADISRANKRLPQMQFDSAFGGSGGGGSRLAAFLGGY